MIKQIEIRNFKSLKHLQYKCAGLNLLTGLNGSGKSSFIQSLLFVRNLMAKGQAESGSIALNSDSCRFGTSKDFFYSYRKGEAAFFAIEQDDNSRCSYRAWKVTPSTKGLTDVHFIWLKHCDPAGVKHRQELEMLRCEENIEDTKKELLRAKKDLAYLITTSDDPSKNEQAFNLSEKIQLLSAKIRKAQKVNTTYDSGTPLELKLRYLSANRLSPVYEHELKGDSNLVGTNLSFGDQGESVVSCLLNLDCYNAFRVDNSLLFPGTTDRSLINQINEWMSIVSPGAKVSFKSNDECTRALLQVGFGRMFTGAPLYRPQNVGFGISQTLPVLALLLTAKAGDVIMIENPEAHLHPRGQAEIGRLIALAVSVGAQIFIETHSDHVINGIRVAVKRKVLKPSDVKIAFFSRGEHTVYGNTHAPTMEIYSSEEDILVDTNGSLSNYPNGFLDQWNYQMMELLT